MERRLGYEYRDTFIHNLHPFAKLVFVNSLAAIGAAYYDIRYLIPLLLLAAYIYLKTEAPTQWIKTFLKFWIIMAINPLTLFWTTFMANPKLYKVLPQEFVSKVIIQITPPGTPILGYTAITYGTLYYWVAGQFRTPYAFMMACVLVYTLNMSDLAQALAGTGIPSHFLFMVTGSYRFVSVLLRMLMSTQDALKLRGWDPKSKDPIKTISTSMPFAASVARRFPSSVHQVAMQMEIRAFTSHRRIPQWRPLRLRSFEIVMMVCSILAVITTQYLLFRYNIGMI